MRASLVAAIAGCLLYAGCSAKPAANSPSRSAPTPAGGAQDAVGDLLVGEPLVLGNLTVFPVTSQQPRDSDRFITLDEGLKAGVVEIVEVGGANGAEAMNGPAAQQESIDPADVPNAAPNNELENPQQESSDVAAPNPAPAEADDAPGADLIQASDFDGLTPAEAAPSGENAAADADPTPAASEPTLPEAPDDDSLRNLANMANDANNVGAGNQVNQLMVVNKSGRPLYLMPGEIIVGGSQDRTIGRELVVAPDGKPVPIEVFCVEHGRWGGRGDAETADLLTQAGQSVANAESVAVTEGADPEQAAAEAARGKFVASVGSLSKSARLAVQKSGDQGEVWEKVGQTNASSGVQADSGAFTHNYVDGASVERLAPYIEGLQKPVAKTERIVGVVVAINGRLDSVDVFESTPLFRKLWPKLLKSYALDAANAQPADGDGPACSHEDAARFLAEAAHADVERSETKDGVMLVHRQSERVAAFAAAEPTASGEAQPSAEVGDAVHFSAFAQ